jgi:hypothetical protein
MVTPKHFHRRKQLAMSVKQMLADAMKEMAGPLVCPQSTGQIKAELNQDVASVEVSNKVGPFRRWQLVVRFQLRCGI